MSIDKEKREEISVLLGYLDGATGTSLCREAAATIRYLMENNPSAAIRNAALEDKVRELSELACSATDGINSTEPHMRAALHLISAELAEALEQSSPAPKQDGWQPIETAPKGKACLIFYRNTFGLARTIKAKFVAKHTVEADEEWPEDACDLDPLTETAYLPEDWYEMMDNHGDYAYVRLESAHNPTHWQPLPPAPQSPESKEGA